MARLEGELKDVEALKDVRVELVTQKEVGLCTELLLVVVDVMLSCLGLASS